MKVKQEEVLLIFYRLLPTLTSSELERLYAFGQGMSIFKESQKKKEEEISSI